MPKRLDLTGQHFGRLIVIESIVHEEQHKWKVKCECGKIVVVRTSSLTSGKTTSCGCYRKENSSKMMKLRNTGKPAYNKQPPLLAAFNRLFKGYKRKAIERDLEFNLTEEEFKNIINQKCYYCNSDFSNKTSTDKSTGILYFNGVDRKDSSIGYRLDNCVPCCKKCNVMKWNFSYEEFIEHCKKVIVWQEK